MCGVVGFLGRDGRHADNGVLASMVGALRARGPDAQTTFVDREFGLGHARLSIIDLAGGSQPIFNETRDVACVLNGEIYNYRELAAMLRARGHRFATHSDTEVIVHLYEEFGLAAFERLEGMFAIVVADLRSRELVVARDRLGEKPFYYLDLPGMFACASELKALERLDGWSATIDDAALSDYLRFGYVRGARSIYGAVRKLLPGQRMVVDGRGCTIERYWKPECLPSPAKSRADWSAGLRDALRESIANKLVADVDVGVFLSGGLDSSTVVALAAGASDKPLKTFSARFGDSINELPLARSVAQRYATDHIELDVDTDVLGALQTMASYFDEPFADSSAVPTYLISKAAREQVKVVLSGDGGDELFGGYESYLRQRRHSRWALVRKLGGLAERVPVVGPRIVDAACPLPGDDGAVSAWMEVRSTFGAHDVACLMGGRAGTHLSDPWVEPQRSGASALDAALEWDLHTYLPDDLLCKVDRASMACGLETRAPLLDHHLVEYALTIPSIEKVRGGVTKSLFREAVEPWLPAGIVRGRKQGFGAPLTSWLKGPVRDLARDVLTRPRAGSLVDATVLDAKIAGAWSRLDTDWRAPLQLWEILMLELWLRRAPASAGTDRTEV